MLVSSISNNVASKPIGIHIEVTKNQPIRFPDTPIEGIASQGIMSLSHACENVFYARGVPENTIFRTILSEDQGELLLKDPKLVLSSQMFPTTHDGKKVIGYEDPTFISKDTNPFCPNEDAFLTSQVYKMNEGNKLAVNLVYIGLDKEENVTHLRTILTPEDIIQSGIVKACDMVKEGELFLPDDGRKFLFFEYGGSDDENFKSNIGIAEIKNGTIYPNSISKFYTADEDNSEHISTDSNPIPINEDLNLLFFNRRRNNEWGITFMLFDNFLNIQHVHPDLIIRAPKTTGLGPGNQLIAFLSHITNKGNGEIEVLYHVNDERPYYALIRLTSSNNSGLTHLTLKPENPEEKVCHEPPLSTPEVEAKGTFS